MMKKGDEFIALAAVRIEDGLRGLGVKSYKDERVKQAIKSEVSSVAKSMVKRRPNVEIHILRAGREELVRCLGQSTISR